MTEPRDDDSLRRTDPLLANPILATGTTGEIERPGDDRSPWVIGLLLAAFASLISGLVTVALTRDDDASIAADDRASVSAVELAAEDEVPSEAADPVDPANPVDPVDPAVPVETEPPGDVPVVTDTAPADGQDTVEDEQEAVETVVLTELDGQPLPAPGFVRVGGDTLPIEAVCEVHLPLAPADNDVQVSSYMFRFDDGRPRVVDRRNDPSSSNSSGSVLEVRLDGETTDDVVVDGDGDESGAFLADFDGAGGLGLVVLNPDPTAATSCGESLVTNEPGQFAFPYSRIVLASCASGRLGTDLFATGLTSDGGRFAAQDNADGTASLSYTTDELGSELLDPSASVFESDGRLGYSGVVTNGAVTLDITIDFTPARGPCVNAIQG